MHFVFLHELERLEDLRKDGEEGLLVAGHVLVKFEQPLRHNCEQALDQAGVELLLLFRGEAEERSGHSNM